MMRFILLLLLLIFGLSCQQKNETPLSYHISDDWLFKKVEDTRWNTAKVPGNVHSDLLTHELIEHPFHSDNELKLQWISESNWEYKTTFSAGSEILNKENIELNFEGLDTYASVYLNDSLILKSNNAFREFNVNIKSKIKGENTLRIVFDKSSHYEEIEKSKLSYTLPEGNRVFTRKAQFQYGWDWGPKLNTCGIWRPIELVAWNDYKIDNIYVRDVKISDSIADLSVSIENRVGADFGENITYDFYVNNSLIHSSEPLSPNTKQDHRIQIKNPKRWWPHNLGEPYLYDIKMVAVSDSQVLDSISIKKGIRTIELISEEDAHGESFYFKVNDIPVYMKGANYIPQNSMQNQVTDTHYEKLLSSVVEANMNMLRVWGGGIYENDIFYDICDREGILVWQDFMFACAMYPGDASYIDNVFKEAKENVMRLRNHASIALWCGNNESSEGWHRWGWQTDRSDAEKEEIWDNYLRVFDTILPKVVKDFSDTDYWESSPKYGRGNPKYKSEGDAHDWWIWHDAYPFEHLKNSVPRFMSEFGFQSFPSYEVINYINQSDSLDIASEGFLNHQKHSRGFQLIKEYMERDFPVPTATEDYVYISQLLQAHGITMGIEAHRRLNPYNMGTLYWQLNDCWPAVSWSSIDYLGNWKALHYKAKHSFKNTLVSSVISDGVLSTYIVNDSLESKRGLLQIDIIDFNGDSLYSVSEEIEAKALVSTLVNTLDLSPLKLNAAKVFIQSTFNGEKSIDYLAKPKDLFLGPESIEQSISKSDNGFRIELSSKSLQKDVFLFCKENGHFSDNYFDLLPNETKVIQFDTQSKSIEGLKFKTLNGIMVK